MDIKKTTSLVYNKENLALRRPVWEDRPWKGKEDWRGNKAVDGLYDNRSALGGQCVISENFARTATWRVDLGDVVSISHIDFYFRTDNRPRNIKIINFNTSNVIDHLYVHSQLL